MGGERKPDTTGQDDAATKAAAEAEAAAKASAEAEDDGDGGEIERLTVTGAAVVLRTADGSERYLYKNSPLNPAQFTEASITHAKDLGLIG